ncbi:lamin tail domain-containing protein, partial [Patescibacteria group bacterium]|nr:lamin tail domain-containing protein [Patescibacteria group bacterium]
MRKYIIKFISISLIVGLNWFGLSAVGDTLAYFNDIESAQENVFSAATLDFSLHSAADFSPKVTPTTTSSRNISVINNGSLGFQYTASTTNTNGSLCDYLNLSADLDGNNKYTGPLTSFYYSAGEFTTPDDWQFTATLKDNDPALQNQTCTFDFVFDGVQIGGAGFYDQEIISNTITSGQWVIPPPPPAGLKINEVYYHVKPPNENEPENEWAEIYNPTSLSIDISGWKITDNSGWERTFCVSPSTCSSTTIPAYGFAVVTPATSTWGYWPGIPSDAVKIVLGKSIGNGLANTGDRVILKNATGVEIDAVSWGDDNYAFGAGNGVKPATGAGHSIARKIKGEDTDTAGDWVDLTTPNPGTNPHLTNGEEIIIEEEIIETEEIAEIEEVLIIEEEPAIIEEEPVIEGETTTTEEIIAEETPIIDDNSTIIEESTTTEETVIEEQPVISAIEEQPA